MARVTVEDCVKIAQDRFELVVLAAERGKRIGSGSPITVDRDNDKDGVIALREIAQGTILIESLRESLAMRLQKLNKIDAIESDDEVLDEDIAEDFEYVADGSDFFVDDSEDFSESSEEGEVYEDIAEEH